MLRALRERPRLTAVIFTVALLLPALLAERLAIPLHYVLPDRSGRSFIALRWLYLLPVMTGAVSLLLTPKTFLRVFRMRYAWVGLACVAVDVAVFTAAGVLERSFKATLSFPLATAASLGSLLTGIALFRLAPAAIDWLIAAATSISALVGGFQMAEATGRHSLPGILIVRWDQASAERLHTGLAWMRAEGFALNPNIYTPFAIVGFIWVLFSGRKGPLRWVTLVSSVAIGMFGQSRTTLIVVVALLGLALLRSQRGSIRRGRGLRIVAFTAALALIAAGVMWGRPMVGLTDPVPRVGSDSGVAVVRPLEDDGVLGRVGAWRIALGAIAQNPWGAFARAGRLMKPYLHAHNEFLDRLLVAGPLWLLAHITFLAWLVGWLRPTKMRWIGAAIAMSLFLNGLTESLAWMCPYNVLLYVIIGCAMWSMAAERASGSVNRTVKGAPSDRSSASEPSAASP